MPGTQSTMSDPEARAEASTRSWVGGKPGVSSRISARAGRRRRIPYLAIGALLVVVCAMAAVVLVLRTADREPVLALAGPVSVGHVLTAQDLRQVPVGRVIGGDVVPASEIDTIIGRPLAYALPRGALLPRSALGSPQVPPDGQALVAVAVKPGQFPPELAAGTRVAVVVVPDDAASTGSAARTWNAVVSSVRAGADGQETVVSLQLPEASAKQVAAVPPGQMAIVALPRGGS